jgi:flavorubredoxin
MYQRKEPTMPPVVLPTSVQPVADETWLVPTLGLEPSSGAFVGVHSLVIRGREPVIVDTGCALVREQWLEQAFSVVDPVDVRWVFLSHDDHDHLGNLDVVLERCPNATLIASFAIVGRLSGDIELPLDRMRWLDVGESLDLGDRVLTAVRPPMFDSPATRGLFDSTTGLLWAADSFGTLMPGEVYEAADIPVELYEASFAALNSWNTPWLEWVDPARFAALVDSTAALPIDVVASAHGPLHRGAQIDDAFRRTLALAGEPTVPMPGSELLDQLLATVVSSAAA